MSAASVVPAAPKGAASGSTLGEVLVREERAKYLAESCQEVYASPPAELLALVRGLFPEGVWLSVQWWCPPVLEVSVWQVSGKYRWVTLEVLPA